MKVIDNFLDNKAYNEMLNLFDSPDFPWFKLNSIVHENIIDKENFKDYMFTHIFYMDMAPRSNFYDIILPLLEKINPFMVYRIKCNLTPYCGEAYASEFHSDLIVPRGVQMTKTGIYYLNSNNGYTEFEDGTRIESVKNRFVEFDTNILHRGVGSTNTKSRILINLNYSKGD